MKKMRCAALFLILAGCGTVHTQYQQQAWSKVPYSQAEAECLAEINRLGGIPSFDLCMGAKGWEEVRQ